MGLDDELNRLLDGLDLSDESLSGQTLEVLERQWRQILVKEVLRRREAAAAPKSAGDGRSVMDRLPVYDPSARVAVPKPDRFARKAEKKRDRREHAQLRDKHRTRIFWLDNGKCRCHGRKVWLKLSDAPHELAVGHVHEFIAKSLGGDDLSDENCILLCAELHGPVQRHEVDIVAHDAERLMRGPVDFVPHDPKAAATFKPLLCR